MSRGSKTGAARSSRKPNAVPGGAPMPLDRKPKAATAIPGGGRPSDPGYDGAWTPGYGKRRRKPNATPGGSTMPAMDYRNRERGDGYGKPISEAPPASAEPAQSGTSIFDPVLAELLIRWFSPPEGVVLDPFAGGSVRGIVASKLGRHYRGVELRAEQVEANRAQADVICRSEPDAAQSYPPIWHTGDSRQIATICAGVEADLILSCPPYADLEVYSEDPRDVSTLAYAEFREAYFKIIAETCTLLKPNRFAAFVVGEVRGPDGFYYGFVPDTVRAFEAAGVRYYNEIILVTAVGSLPIRVGAQFRASRKVGKTHQNVLVFCKGDPKRAAEACGVVDLADMPVDESKE